MKEAYENAELEIVKFHTQDVITTSVEYEDDELPLIKG